ncbi:MAG TPA: undecaprenyldiphospho-muramoylpentapeptide beta-N-acetylglucosaminyltransferase [Terriglobales bacterium]|nr:undecaprenyldiphospho-muramoylpentapeptide beta-N-acetylglucosaminyltransferase [Terriglobales bacterium]
MRAVLAGGGTGGHVIPALAIARELQNLYQAEVLFVGTARGMETRLVPAAGYRLELIKVGQLNRVSLATRVRTLVDLPMSVAHSARLLGNFNPDVVIGVGGYASGPAMAAAWLKGIPSLIFEPNLIPGFTNRMAARMASEAAVQFEQTGSYFRKAKVTGVPVRESFFQIPARPSEAVTTLLVFGGSQGSRAINRAVLSALPLLKERMSDFHLIHQTGEREYNDAREAYAKSGLSAEVFPFINDMAQAFCRADLLLCRSGASTVAEIAAAGKAVVFIPLPTAADDHQRKNAEALVEAGAGVLLPEKELTPERLADTLVGLLADRARLARMSLAARNLAHPDAAKEIAGMAARLAGVGRD